MKKAIIICLIIFGCLGVLYIVLFGMDITIKKIDPNKKLYTYEQSPFYKKTIRNNTKVIYLNIWASYSPYSVERYQELIQDKNKIVYNLSLDKDSAAIKKTIEKFRIQNDITLENYNYQAEILKNVYSDRRLSFGEFLSISDYSTPMTFVFDKQVLKKKF
ncbi:hypothetical protein QFZ37_000321 [Chryseobacterium ginsenosidimutans]|uniref:TlpA family protein disulfide reductase n=1 Tax=Chryseobacterium ginsenosidimutans TaxID=687846 RepID=UPI002785C2F7|nr:hypothetical protein [Chryseobacterium ginsenosidimutans]MDQ0591952.1 hypothetical protein [Chryseobacterium ginsenosidimutans]